MSRDGIIECDDRKTLYEYEILAFDRQVTGYGIWDLTLHKTCVCASSLREAIEQRRNH